MKNKIYKKIRLRMVFEGIIKYLFISLSLSLGIVGLVLLITKFIPYQLDYRILLIGGGIIFVLSFIIPTVITYPKKREVARRIDKDFNMYEQMITADEFKLDKENEMIKIQRETAYRNLNDIKKIKAKFKFSFIPLILLLVSGITLSTATVVPYRRLKEPDISDVEEKVDIGETIDKIDDILGGIDDNEVFDDEMKEEIKDILDKLKEDLEKGENDPNDEIDDAIKELENQKDGINKEGIGESLIKNGLEELGQAIKDGDKDKVSEAIDKIKEELEKIEDEEELKDALNDLADKLGNIEESEDTKDTSLEDVLLEASDELEDVATSEENKEDMKMDAGEILDQMKEGILEALDEQAKIDFEIDKIIQELENMKSEEKDDPKDPDTDKKPDGEMQEFEDGENNAPIDNTGKDDIFDDDRPAPDRPFDGNGHGEVIYAENELIYNPTTNEYIKYGDLLNTYYALVNGEMAEANVSKDILELTFEYFGYLFYKDENEDNAEENNNEPKDESEVINNG